MRSLRIREAFAFDGDFAAAGFTELRVYARDRVEVAVVMEEGRVVHFGDRSDQQIDRRGAAVLAPLGKGRLHARSGELATVVKR